MPLSSPFGRSPFVPRGRLVRAKILLAAVAQPHPQGLGNLVFLLFAQGAVQGQSLFPLLAAGGIVVGIPVTAGHPNAATHLFDQGFAL